MMEQATRNMAWIRQGLSQYVGALAVGIQGNPEEKKQLITAALSEEALGIIRETDGVMNLYAAKPILRAAILIVQEYDKKFRAAVQMTGINAEGQISKNENCISVMQNIVDNAKKIEEDIK